MPFKASIHDRFPKKRKAIVSGGAGDRRVLCWSWGCLVVAALMAILAINRVELLARPGSSQPQLDTGEKIYKAGCVSCHGPDGKGQSAR